MIAFLSFDLRRWRACLGGFRAFFLVLLLLPACVASEAEVPVIKIGLVAPFEGSFRYVGYDAIYAARLAVREINRAGGAGGWRLELVAYDDRGDPEMAAQAARNLVADPAVVAVLGHYRPETTGKAGPIYASAGLPFITLGAWGPPASTTWHLMPPSESLLDAMQALGTGERDVEPVLWGTPSVGEVTAREVPWDGDSTVSSEAPLVLSFLPPVAAGETLSRWRREGWTGQLVGDLELAASAFGTLAGPAVMGTVFVTPYPFPAHVPNAAGWISDYQAVGPHVPAPGPYALPTYEAVYVLAEALASVSGDAARGIIARQDAAQALEAANRSGWLGAIAWDEAHCWRNAPLYGYRWMGQGPELVGELAPGVAVP